MAVPFESQIQAFSCQVIMVLQLLISRDVSAFLLEYWIEHVTIGLIYVKFVF